GVGDPVNAGRHAARRVELAEPDADQRPLGHAHVRAPASRIRTSGTQASPIDASSRYTTAGDVHASRLVAATGPMKPAPIRAALITPIAEPPACWPTRETTSGNTGAIDSTCRNRRPP